MVINMDQRWSTWMKHLYRYIEVCGRLLSLMCPYIRISIYMLEFKYIVFVSMCFDSSCCSFFDIALCCLKFVLPKKRFLYSKHAACCDCDHGYLVGGCRYVWFSTPSGDDSDLPYILGMAWRTYIHIIRYTYIYNTMHIYIYIYIYYYIQYSLALFYVQTGLCENEVPSPIIHWVIIMFPLQS